MMMSSNGCGDFPGAVVTGYTPVGAGQASESWHSDTLLAHP